MSVIYFVFCLNQFIAVFLSANACVAQSVELTLYMNTVVVDYFQSAVGIPRPGGGVTGAPGPGGLTTAPSQQVITAGGPPTQLGQPGGPVTMGLVQGPVVPGLATGDTTAGQTNVSVAAGKQTRRKYALDIVDPKTMKNVEIYDGSAASSSTPPRSGDSSARDTPQPVSDILHLSLLVYVTILKTC